MVTPADQLAAHARSVRRRIIQTVTPVRGSHTGGSLSAVDFLVALYFDTLHIDPARPNDPRRDLLIYSKGHCAAALYATLVERGFAPPTALAAYGRDGGLASHPVRGGMPGVEWGTGSLGHGLPVALGAAHGRQRRGNPGRVFCVLSDGECDEGSTWEAALNAGFHRLDHLVAVVDYNRIQSFGRTDEVLGLEPFADKWRAFGWGVREVDGHDFGALLDGFGTLPIAGGKPSVVICRTVKGKGIRQMEDQLAWHYKSLDDPADYARAMRELL